MSNKRNIQRTSKIMLDQIDSIISSNERDEQRLLAELKEEYIERAVTVSYILESKPDAIKNLNELSRIAAMLNIDEINIFNDKGVIEYSTFAHYVGYSFDSGEQIGFFKPMLTNKTLKMCQDVTPNTAEAKSMMYSITWDRTKTYMVQVGIEPVRLLAELKENSIQEVVSQMPVYAGLNIYIADINSGEILGSTNRSLIGKSIFEGGILRQNDDLTSINYKTVTLDNFKNYCHFRQYKNYLISVVHSTKTNLESFIISIVIEVVWLLISGTIILLTLYKLTTANKKINEQMSLLSSISDIYYSIHIVDLQNFSVETIEGNPIMDQVMAEESNASAMLEKIILDNLEPEFHNPVLEFTNLTTLKDRLKNNISVSFDAVDKNVGWLRITFIKMEANLIKTPSKVILTTQIIDEDKKREEELSIKVLKDGMTGVYNRRGYEQDILSHPGVPPEADFVFAAIDINGLKVTNDELGHAAGDELIIGAADCLKRALGTNGRIFRTGGDEFVSIFFADEEHLQAIARDLETIVHSWKGETVKSLSLAVGYVTKREFPTETVVNLAKIADKRMYAAKAEYYSIKGVDRRGQAAAHKALCNLYTKIFKINLTEDSYTIVNMTEKMELGKEKINTDKISEWLYSFGKSGMVHEDDLPEYLEKTNIDYLKKYFSGGKTSLCLFYRRKIRNSFKPHMMEMIPADDYSNENQTLFLYVKSMEK